MVVGSAENSVGGSISFIQSSKMVTAKRVKRAAAAEASPVKEEEAEEEVVYDKENEENAGATKGVAVGSNVEPVASPLVQAR